MKIEDYDWNRLIAFENALQAHAETLSREGIGQVSEMCRMSIMDNFRQDPRFLRIYVQEADAFSAMAERIAPPAMVAEYLKIYAADNPKILRMKKDEFTSHCAELHRMTSADDEGLSDTDRRHSSSLRYTPSEMKGYMEFCEREPNLQLASIYFGFELQQFIRVIANEMTANQYQNDLEMFGRQINAKNLTIALPLAIQISLARRHGKNATIDQVDSAVMEGALRFMDTTEQFEAKGTGTGLLGKMGPMSVRCPMKRYVFDLLLKQDGFVPYLNGVRRFSERTGCEDAAVTGHKQNMKIVSETMGEGAREYA